MPTPIPDDELFAFAQRVKGKVVVITGASDLVANRASGDRLTKIHHPCRRCERHWERGRTDFCKTWVGDSLRRRELSPDSVPTVRAWIKGQNRDRGLGLG